MKYFPILRCKEEELRAVRSLADEIATNGRVIPILEPIRLNRTLLPTLSACIEASMPFLFICNPCHGLKGLDFARDPKRLKDEVIDSTLGEYDKWVPALYVDGDTKKTEIKTFIRQHGRKHQLAVVYYGQPKQDVCEQIKIQDILYHVFIGNGVRQDYIRTIPKEKRVDVTENFWRRDRNADYPEESELFTEQNTLAENRDDLNFGDFSIQGDHFSDGGGPPNVVALHHIHILDGVLYVRHFTSDKRMPAGDQQGKRMKAVDNLVAGLSSSVPNDTATCQKYREFKKARHAPSLGHLKRLGIKHHLEVIMGENVLEGKG